MNTLRTCIASLLAAGCVLPAAAEPAMTQLDTVTVEATRRADLPDAERVDADALQRRAAARDDVAGLLTGIGGVGAWGAGGVSSLPAIRGLADDRLRIQVDGMGLTSTCPNHMNPPLSYVDPAQVAQVRVYTGIVPVSVGGDSIGGSIVVETAPPRFARDDGSWVSGGEIGARARGNGNGHAIDARAVLAGPNVQLAWRGSTAQADNYRAGGPFKSFTITGRDGMSLPQDEVGSTAYEVRNQQVDVAWRRGEHVFDLRVGLQDMPFQNYPNQRMDLTDNRQHRYNASWHGPVGRLVVDARLWHESVEHAMDFGDDKRFWYGMASMPPGVMGLGRACVPVSPSCAAGMPMLTDSHTNGGRLAVDLPLDGADVVRLGGEFIAYRLDDYWPPSGGNMWPGTFVNINAGKRDRAGLFAEWESSAGEWTRLVGLRVERVDTDAGPVRGYDIDPAPPGSFMMTAADAVAFNARDRERNDTNWDFAALARRTLGEHATLEFGVSRRTRSPNLYERYAWSTWAMAALMNNTVGDGNGYVGDPGLKPEVAHTLSATLDARTGADGYSLRVSPFYTRVSDYIDAIGVSALTPRAFNVLRHANQDARLAGVDLTAATPSADTAFGRFTLRATASALDGENRDTGAGLYNIVPLQGRVVFEHRAGDWSNSVEVVGVARKDDLSGVRNEIGTPGYGLLDLRLGWKRGDLAVDFGVENVLDRLYRLPQGGAYLGQGTTMMITGVPWGIAVPGRGRAWYAGLRVAF